MLRSLPVASAPSAHDPGGALLDARPRAAGGDSGTPVHSLQLVRPCVPWTLFSVGARRSRTPCCPLALDEAGYARWRARRRDFFIHGQDHRTIDQAMDQETVLRGVNVRKAAALHHIMKRTTA